MKQKRSNYSRTWLPGFNTSERSLLGLVILVMLFVILLKTYTRRKKMNIVNRYATDLYLFLVAQGFLPVTAQMITAQAAHESGNFTSPVFIHNNNPFGMRLPEIRMTTALGEYKGYAVYGDLEASARDYWLYYQYCKYPMIWKDTDTFVTALKNKAYFEAPLAEYQVAVKKFFKLYFVG
jgi:hypothetical protein